MKSYLVKDLMVPLEEYATVSEKASLPEAVDALEKSQQAFNEKHDRHRAVLVLDDQGRVVGKLSQHDLLKALEPNYEKMEKAWQVRLSRFGVGEPYVKNAIREFSLWQKPLQDLCGKAFGIQVRDIMYAPGEGETVDAESTMDDGVHRLITGRHHSLLVTQGGRIVGILRLADVFELVGRGLKECR